MLDFADVITFSRVYGELCGGVRGGVGGESPERWHLGKSIDYARMDAGA